MSTSDREFAGQVTQANWIATFERTVQEDAAIGRKVLVVIGSGCSIPRGLPTMSQIFQYLRDQLDALKSSFPHGSQDTAIRLLERDLSTLVAVGGPRSVAARALRMLQHSEFEAQTGDDRGRGGSFREAATMCARLWSTFGDDFLRGTIRRGSDERLVVFRDPTDFHLFVARLVIAGVAIPISLNFDGFTRRAIDRSRADGRRCVILDEPEQLRSFLCAGSHHERSVPYVVKVWGDVFHAVCHNPFCPRFEKPVPLYAMKEPGPAIGIAGGADVVSVSSGENGVCRDGVVSAGTMPDGSELLSCPDCGEKRQLRIFFAGYQEKELGTRKLIGILDRFVTPQIGSILVAGFSGEWDSSLMDLLLRLGRRCQDDRGGPSVFCLDPKSTYAQRAMEAAGVKTVSLAAPADSVAHLSMQLPSPRESATESVRVGDEEWSFWRPLLDEKEGRANLPAWCNGWTAGFSNTLGQLRQLGIKTRLLHHDYKHTRLRHSVGCATLAWRWHNRLCAEHHLPSYRDYPPSLTTLAAALHDMGHPPFSHLTEEVMDELRWTVPGADRFRHDTGPFGTAWPHVSNAAVKLVEREVGAARVELAKNRLTLLIEGRSGVPAFSAILNSPLDVDKIDYVFRDCNILNRSVHLPATGNSEKEQNERANWFAEFLSHQIVLPSGLIGLWGRAGEKARELLEERWYLYRNVYHHPSFRAVEKVVRAILTFWLCRRVSRLREPTTGIRGHFDPRSENGRLARHILWRLLTNTSDDLTPKHVEGGEAMLVHRVCDDILGVGALGEGLEMVPFLSGEEREWFERCKFVLGKLLPSGGPERTMDELDRTVGMLITIGQPMFVSRADFNNKVRDIIRTLEYDNPFTALIDAASMPRMLSYPRQPGADSIAECYVLPHADPDHWNQSPPPRWWPLSETVFSERDKDENRQVQLLVVSPMDGDYNTVRHVTDRLRSGCDQRGVEVLEGMRNI